MKTWYMVVVIGFLATLAQTSLALKEEDCEGM